MPIVSIHDGGVAQVCAACGKARDVSNAKVVLQASMETSSLELPPCETCGSVEVLMPRFCAEAHPTPGSYGHRHQLLVDELAARRMNTKLPKSIVEEIERWLPDGLRLEAPKR